MTRDLPGALEERGLTEDLWIAKSGLLIAFNQCRYEHQEAERMALTILSKEKSHINPHLQINQITVRKTSQIAKIQNLLETKICRRGKKRL